MVKDIPQGSFPEIYERCIQNLILIVKRVHESETSDDRWNPTARKKAIEKIAKKLEETAGILRVCGSAQQDIELIHDAPVTVVGVDGWPIEHTPGGDWRSYRSIQQDIKQLAKTARLAAEQLPDSRKRYALKIAARGLLHLRHDYDFPPVSLYNDSADVIELERICDGAGIYLTREGYRGALAESLKTFDSRFTEPYLNGIFK